MLFALTCVAPLFLGTAIGAPVPPASGTSTHAVEAPSAAAPQGRDSAAQRRGSGGSGAGPNTAPARAAGRSGDGPQVVSFNADDKLTLAAHYWAPRGNEHAPGVVLIHDAGASRETFGDLAVQLHRKGFAVLAVDLRGHGGSVSERSDFAKSTPEQRATLWALAMRDVQAAALWLRQRPEVHSTNLNLVGVGSGVGLAVRHAVRDENVRSLVLVRPCSEQYGFDLAGDLRALEGLPTYFAAPSEVRDEVKSLLGSLAAQDTVKIDYVRDSEGPLLDERRLPRSIVGWIADQALPKRGRS